jgi:thiol:disulfide interchange protein
MLIASLLAGTQLTPRPAVAAESPKTTLPDIYDESADAGKQIADAVAQAKKENKRVLLQFGANWCGWCHKLHKLFETDKEIAANLKANYVVALIDVNKGHNKDIVARYEGEKLGLPFIVILGPDGKQLTLKDSGELEEGDHHSPQKVMTFLAKWAPPR